MTTVHIVWRKHKTAPGAQHVATVQSLSQVCQVIEIDKAEFSVWLHENGTSKIADYDYFWDIQRSK